MTGNKIKEQILAIIAKFYEINDNEEDVIVPRTEFGTLSDAEIHTVLKSLRKNGMVDILDDRITTDMFNQKLKEYKEKQQYLIEKIQTHDKADETFLMTINTVLSLAQRAYQIFESSEPSEKRQLLNFLLQNLTLKDKTLQYKLKAPFDTVLLVNGCSDLLPIKNSNKPRGKAFSFQRGMLSRSFYRIRFTNPKSEI